MSATKKIAKALIGGNWKSNGTVASIRQMADALNRAGHFSANSEVVIAAPSLHLHSLKQQLRSDIAVSAEVCSAFFSIESKFDLMPHNNRMLASSEVTEHLPESLLPICLLTPVLCGP